MNYKKARTIIWIFSAVVALLVIILHELPSAETPPAFSKQLPLLNAMINGMCFLNLLAALGAIKRKDIKTHRKLVAFSMILSVGFLLSYVIYHYFNGNTSYGGEYKMLYTFIVLTHIVLAGVSLPFILLAYAKAYFQQIEAHKKMVRWVYPIWLYVTFTGVLVYLFLSPYYV
jgi:putative membrane protein